MESNSARRLIAFTSLQVRLIGHVKARIQNGEFTERGLARMLAISQPHLHNVLKGARKINPELADRLLRKFGLSVLHLLEDAELAAEVIARGLLPLDTPATKHARFRNNPGTHVADDE